MAEWAYTDTVKDHFTNPRNILEDEDSYSEDGKGFVGSPACGDMMMVVIKIDDAGEKIADCKWKTYGCASAVASTSMMSEMVIGMPIKEAFNLTPQKIMAALGGLPDNKVHCSVLGDRALREAIKDYYKRSGKEDLIPAEDIKIICDCIGVTDVEIEEAVLEGAHTFEKLQEVTKVATSCGKCQETAEKLLEEIKAKYFGDE